MRTLFAALVLLSLAAAARAERAPVQIGDHRNLGRIVITLASPGAAVVQKRGNRIDVTVPGDVDVATPDNVPRNVLSFTGAHGAAHLTVLAGAQVKTKQEGKTFFIDVLDPASRGRDAAATAGSRPNPGKAALAEPAPEAKKPPATAAEQPAPPVVATPASTAPEPAPAPPASPPPSRALRLLAGPDVGVAAFRRGDRAVLVFDDKVDLATSDDDPPIRANLRTLQRGTMVTFKLAEDEQLAFRHSASAWTVTIAQAVGSPAPAAAVSNGIQYDVAKPGRVMAVSDPISGQTLLVGTTRQADGEHALVDAARSAPGYALLPSWLGLVLEASSDRIDLRVSLSGYTLVIADRDAANRVAAPVPENQLSIPNASPEVLARQLQAQVASAAAAPPRSRGPGRVGAARTMLSLGLSAESQALLTLAAAEDPAIAQDPANAALTGVAAILAGRPAEAGALDDASLPTGGDMALWRGLRDAAEGKPTPSLGASWPLLASYPEPIRQQIAPPVMEAAVKEGIDVPAAALEGPTLAIARALQAEHKGDSDGALAALDTIANGRDERDSVRAKVAATELRLATNRITPGDAADVLDRQAARWRGGEREITFRLRAAELRTQAGQWRGALTDLRQTEQLFPATKAKIAALKNGVFRALLAAPNPGISPLEFVAIAGDFADGLPDGEDGSRLAGLLADKLAALDLPSQAVPVLQHLMEQTESGPARVEYALRLAQLQLDAGQPNKAEAVLADLDMSDASVQRQDQRALLLARAQAGRGDFLAAAQSLLTVNSSEADDLRAMYYAQAGEWQHSLETLVAIASKAVPETGALTEQQQDILLREATAAVQAGDSEALRRLARLDKRISPPRSDLFRVLTATPIRSPDDLPRAARELAISRALPDRLASMKAP